MKDWFTYKVTGTRTHTHTAAALTFHGLSVCGGIGWLLKCSFQHLPPPGIVIANLSFYIVTGVVRLLQESGQQVHHTADGHALMDSQNIHRHPPEMFTLCTGMAFKVTLTSCVFRAACTFPRQTGRMFWLNGHMVGVILKVNVSHHHATMSITQRLPLSKGSFFSSN